MRNGRESSLFQEMRCPHSLGFLPVPPPILTEVHLADI